MAQRLVSEEGEDSGDNEGEEEGDDEGDEDEGEDLIYQPEDFQNELFPSEDQPYDTNIQDDSNQAILIPQGGLDFDEDSNGEITEEDDDDSQIPSDWSQDMDEDEMVDNGFYVPEEPGAPSRFGAVGRSKHLGVPIVMRGKIAPPPGPPS